MILTKILKYRIMYWKMFEVNKMTSEKKEVYLTSAGFLEIENELDELKKVKRPEIIKAIKEARALGDLSENADYHAAREEQAIIEGRIQELEYMVEHAVIIEEASKDKVSLGSTIVIKYVGEDVTVESPNGKYDIELVEIK